MELPQTLESLHRHLDLLVDLLKQEQDVLLQSSQGAENGERLSHLAQEKQQQFQSLELLESERDGLAAAFADTARVGEKNLVHLARWQEVRELAGQAARLHQLNSTLIRHSLVHQQCMLNSLCQRGSVAPAAIAATSMAPTSPPETAEQNPEAAPARKRRSRRKTSTTATMEE